jgi:uncharacterized protein YxjI
MLLDSPDFYRDNEYFIDERVGFFKFTNQYKIYNNMGVNIGIIKQVMPAGQKILRLFLNKSMLPFRLEICDADNHLLGTIYRGWTFWMSKIILKDGNGQSLGLIKQKFKLFKSKFDILDESGNKMIEVNGDWKAWNFSITDAQGREVGSITKKWAGVAKEFFTTADKYIVTVNSPADQQQKTRVLAIAITMDMLLKEK